MPGKGTDLGVTDYPIPCQPARGYWGMMLSPVLLELGVGQL